EKIKKLDGLGKDFKKAKHLIFAEYKGLSVEQMTDLRKQLRSSESEFTVVKNTLGMLAYKNAELELKDDWFAGPLAVVFCNGDDFTKPLGILYKFSKNFPELKIKVGFLDHSIYDPEKLQEIAQLPSREQLLARLAALLNAPISSLVFTLKAMITQLVLVLKAIEDKKPKNKK
ncbi:MAG: 50S ribosomal protein L10, partial [Spirochaetes bacterium]|nr:50S ribosomal protein L10 [Spirochaetota bacterium]